MRRSDAYKVGYRWANDGEPYQENPYPASSQQWSDWRDGWRAAKADHEERKARERASLDEDK